MTFTAVADLTGDACGRWRRSVRLVRLRKPLLHGAVLLGGSLSSSQRPLLPLGRSRRSRPAALLRADPGPGGHSQGFGACGEDGDRPGPHISLLRFVVAFPALDAFLDR